MIEERNGEHAPVLSESAFFPLRKNTPAWRFAFGAVGTTVLYVLGGSLDDALETAAAWLAKEAPGHFSEVSGEEETVDHTYTEAGWIPSWEWTVDEVTDRTTRRALAWRLLDEQESDWGPLL